MFLRREFSDAVFSFSRFRIYIPEKFLGYCFLSSFFFPLSIASVIVQVNSCNPAQINFKFKPLCLSPHRAGL